MLDCFFLLIKIFSFHLLLILCYRFKLKAKDVISSNVKPVLEFTLILLVWALLKCMSFFFNYPPDYLHYITSPKLI